MNDVRFPEPVTLEFPWIGPRKVANFQSSVVLTDDAKSGRYTKPAGS